MDCLTSSVPGVDVELSRGRPSVTLTSGAWWEWRVPPGADGPWSSAVPGRPAGAGERGAAESLRLLRPLHRQEETSGRSQRNPGSRQREIWLLLRQDWAAIHSGGLLPEGTGWGRSWRNLKTRCLSRSSFINLKELEDDNMLNGLLENLQPGYFSWIIKLQIS